MATARFSRYTFDGEDLPSGDGADWDKATIDRAIAGFARGIIRDHDDRAGAAITLGTAFLCAGQTARPKKVEQRGIGREAAGLNRLGVQGEFERSRHTQ